MKRTIIEILNDLKNVFLALFLLFVSLFILCYLHREKIYQIIAIPITEVFNKNYKSLFVYTSIFESFTADLSLSLYSSLMLIYPVLLCCIYWFIGKSLYTKEKIYFLMMLFFSLALVFLATNLVYYFLLPHFIKYFAFDVSNASPMFKIGEYVCSFFHLIFVVSLVFQFPFILLFLVKFGIVKSNVLKKYRKFAIVVIFIISAIITPPDVFSQILVAGFLIMIYEITNFCIKRFSTKH